MDKVNNDQEVIEELKQQGEEVEYAIDLSNLPKQTHRWVKRGIKVSCESGSHPYHSHFLTKR